MPHVSDPSPPSASFNEPLQRVDWLALAPWLILLKAPAVACSAMLFGVLGVLLSFVWLDAGPTEEASTAMVTLNATQGISVEPLAFVEYTLSPIAGAFGGEAGSSGSRVGGIVIGVWRLIVWAFVGLAIVQTAARSYAFARPLGVVATARGALSQLPAPLGSIALIAAFLFATSVPLFFLGGLLRTTLIAWPTAILWPMAILLGAIGAVLSIGAVVGAPLLWVAVAIDRADAFDAASRMYAYAFQRIGRLAFYLLMAAAIGVASGLLLEMLASATLGFVDAVATGKPDSAPGKVSLWWESFFLHVVRAYYPAYFFAAATAIYLLLRRDIDGQSMDETDFAEA